MGQPRKTIEDVKRIVAQCKFRDRKLKVAPMGDNGCYIQVQYMEACIDTGEMELQKARKWYTSFYSTDTEVVETVFKALRVSNDHVLKEHFPFQGRRVYSPHFDIEARMHLCDEWEFDGRVPLEK